jgi:hypothetical protein
MVLATGLLSACADVHQRRLFPNPPLRGEKIADLAALPADLEIGADGAWSPVAEASDPAANDPVPFRLNGETLLVPVARGTFDARIDRVLAPSGTPQVGWSREAGVLAAAARGGRGRPGTVLVIVRLGDGTTRVVAGWEMDEQAGYQGITAMRISPDGAFVACQLVENHPGGKNGFREVARRGLIVPLADDGAEVVDLGPDVAGPLRWSPDGRDLYFVRKLTLYRLRVAEMRRPARPGPDGAEVVRAAVGGAPGPAPVAAVPSDTPLRRAQQDEVLEPIMQLSSGDAVEKVAAAQRLAGLPHPMAVGPLIQALEAGNADLCRAADGALRAIVANPAPPSIGGAQAHDCTEAAGAWRAFWSSHPEALAG